jgi:hypothetical protein
MSDHNKPIVVKRGSELRPGRFKAWSVGHEEYEDGPGHFPVAIVEYDDGSVSEVSPELIMFADRDVQPKPTSNQGG